MIWWKTEFVNAGGQLYGVELHADVPGAVPASDGWAALADEEPVIVDTDTVTPVKDFIQSSRARVRLVVRSAPELLKLYALADTSANCVRLLLRRNGVPVWGGFMDAEGVEIPETYRTLFVSELSFGDFAPLKLVKFRPRGIISISEILTRTVGGLGTPVKTDGAFLTSEPAREGLDTNLLGTDASLYDLLELVCMATVSTVRQWGVVRFDNPLRVKAGKDLTKIYGDDNALRTGRIYNTINYALENPDTGDKAAVGEVRAVTGGSVQKTPETETVIWYERHLGRDMPIVEERQRPLENRGEYVYTSSPRSTDHTFKELTRAFGWAKADVDGTGPMKYAVPLTYSPGDSAQYLKDLDKVWSLTTWGALAASVESGTLHTVDAPPLHISAPMCFLYPFANKPNEGAVDNMFYVTFPVQLIIKDADGAALFSYDGKAWQKGGSAAFRLAWRRGGLSTSFLDCENPDEELERAKKNDGKWVEPKGIDVNLPAGLVQGCKATLNVYDRPGYAQVITFSSTISSAQSYYVDYVLSHSKDPGGYLLESLTLSQGETSEEDTSLTVEAFISPEVMETLDYTTKVSTYDKVPAWIYWIGDLAIWNFKPYLRDTQHHWEVVFESLYALYGVRGTELGLRIKGEPASQSYTYGGRTYLYAGGSYDVRRDRCDIELLEINTKDTWNGEKI